MEPGGFGRAALGVVVITEIPSAGPKAAADRKDRRAPDSASCRWWPTFLRDEFTEDMRIVMEPKSRTIDPALMMDDVRSTELEAAFR